MIGLAMNSVLCPLDIQLVIKHRQVDHIKIIYLPWFRGVLYQILNMILKISLMVTIHGRTIL